MLSGASGTVWQTLDGYAENRCAEKQDVHNSLRPYGLSRRVRALKLADRMGVCGCTDWGQVRAASALGTAWFA